MNIEIERTAKGKLFLTDGGLETTLVFHECIDLPCFAAFGLLGEAQGRETLRRYYRRYADIAIGSGCGFGLLHRQLRAVFPQISVLGGCCGTDHRHVEAIRAVVCQIA